VTLCCVSWLESNHGDYLKAVGLVHKCLARHLFCYICQEHLTSVVGSLSTSMNATLLHGVTMMPIIPSQVKKTTWTVQEMMNTYNILHEVTGNYPTFTKPQLTTQQQICPRCPQTRNLYTHVHITIGPFAAASISYQTLLQLNLTTIAFRVDLHRNKEQFGI
jgi:hypothetical protein